VTAAAPSTRSRPVPAADRAPSRRVAASGVRNGTSQSPAQPTLGRQLIDATSDALESGLRRLQDLYPLHHFGQSVPRSTTPGTPDRDMTTPAPVGTLDPLGRAAPIEDRTLSRPRPITPDTVSPAGLTDRPVPDRVKRAGTWAYYAEQYARTHGCEHSDGRTTLEYKHPEFEVHRIRCTNGRNLLLRCSAGSCIRLKES